MGKNNRKGNRNEMELERLGLIKPSPHQSSKESQKHGHQKDIGEFRQHLLDMELRSILDTQKNIRQRAITFRQWLLGSIDPTSNPRAYEQAMHAYELAQQAVAPLVSLLQSRCQEVMSQLPGSLATTSNPQAHQLPDDIVDCSDTPRRSARLKAKPTESPEGQKPTKRERRSSGKKGKADKKDAEDGENKATKAAEDAAAAAGAQESTDVEMKDAEGNADKAGKVHAEGNADKAEGEEVPKTTAEGGKEAEEGKEEKEVSTTLEGKEDENADKKMEDSLMLIPTSEAKENANADKEKLEDSEALAQAQLIEKESESADKKTHQGIRHLM